MSLLQSNSTPYPQHDIPLRCNVCSKQPNFSDTSHLLTHLQSKGHLAAVFKLKNSDPADFEARDTLREYHLWYNSNGLPGLMSDRMNQKKNRKASGTASRRTTSNTSSSRNTPAPQGPRNLRRPAGQTRLDPQLNRRVAAPLSRSATPLPLSYFDAANFGHSLAPTQASWGHGSFFSNSPSTIKQESPSSFDDDDDDYVDGTYPPQRRPALRQRSHNSISATPYPDEASAYGSDDLEIRNEEDKLKGKFWKGMGLFDSATPDMKRKRNQKKEPCVLQALQDTSRAVQDIESVWDSAGRLQKERLIDGLPPSDDDLIEGESSPEPDQQKEKRPRRKAARQPLIKKEPNTGRVTRGSRLPAPLTTRTSRGAYYDGGDDEDDDLTYQERPAKRRAGFSIHRDDTGPEITFSHPASMSHLNAGYPMRNGHNLVQRQQMYENTAAPQSHTRQASWTQSMAFRPSTHSANPSVYPTFNAFGQYPMTNNSFATFGSAFGPTPMTMPLNNDHLYQVSAGGDLGWSMFGEFPETVPDPVDSVMGDNNGGLDMGVADGIQSNPHFLSDAKPEIEDDEGTISATSEH